MQTHKFVEFITVFGAGLAVGAVSWLIVTYLVGIPFYVAMGLMVAGTVMLLRVLRKRFNRQS